MKNIFAFFIVLNIINVLFTNFTTMSKYIIPVDDFKKFLDENKNFIPYYIFAKLSIFAEDYFVNEVKEEEPKTNKLVEDAKKHFKTFMDADYVDSWMEHNKTFLDKLNEIANKKKPFNILKEVEPIFKDIRENSKSFVEKIKNKPTTKRKFSAQSKTSDNGNLIVHWKLEDNNDTYEGFGSKGVGIAKALNKRDILTDAELEKILNIHNFCKAYGKNS